MTAASPSKAGLKTFSQDANQKQSETVTHEHEASLPWITESFA